MQQEEKHRETKFRTWDEQPTDDSGRCLSGGIGQGGAEEGFPARRVSLLPIPPRRSNRGLDSLKFASTIAFVPRAARHLGRFHRPRRYIFLGNRTRSNGIAAFHHAADSFSDSSSFSLQFIDSQSLDIFHCEISFLSSRYFCFKTINYCQRWNLT